MSAGDPRGPGATKPGCGLSLIAAGCLTALALVGCGESNGPPALDAPPARSAETARIAGAPDATPLLRRMADVFRARQPGAPVLVDAPLGGRGARRALADGALDAAIVLAPTDSPPGPDAVAVATTRVVVAAGPSVRERRIAPARLAAVLRGQQTEWSEGLPARVLLRPPEDPAQRALADADPRLKAALAEALAADRWRVVHRASDLRAALVQTPGAITFVDTGQLALHAVPAWTLALEGLPQVDLTVWLLPGAEAAPRVRAFIDFVRGPQGQALSAELGYDPPPSR